MFKRIAVGDMMTKNFVAVRPTANLRHCAKELVKYRINTLLIAEGKKLLGIITSRDILWTITKKPDVKLSDIKAIEIASKKVAVIKPSADVAEAINKMKKYGYRRLPVLAKGEIVGIITLKDILRIDPNILREVSEIDEIREKSEKLKKIAKLDTDKYDIEGVCDECESFAQLLRVEGRLLCPYCRDDLY